MNTTELIDAVSAQAVLTKAETRRTVEAVFDAITRELMAGNDVRITDFGTFHYHERPATMGRNPVTGERLNVAMKRQVRLKMGSALREAMNPRAPAMRRRA